jgi:hypothetical protein
VSFHVRQFRDAIERVLEGFDPKLNTPAAVNLLLGTAAQESHLGTYLKQQGGPAIGVFQMEPATFNDIRDRFKAHHPELAAREAWELEFDLRLAIIMARLKYRSIRSPLPDANDVTALALYWKAHYNTPLGKGLPEEFAFNYRRYVG